MLQSSVQFNKHWLSTSRCQVLEKPRQIRRSPCLRKVHPTRKMPSPGGSSPRGGRMEQLQYFLRTRDMSSHGSRAKSPTL